MCKKIVITSLLLFALVLLGLGGLVGCTSGADETDNTAAETESRHETESQGENTEENTTAADNGTDPESATEDLIDTESMTEEETVQETIHISTAYDVNLITTAKDTAAGSVQRWQNETTNGNGPTENSVIISPFHELTVNGQTVPVYTARCSTGTHSFAWIDVTVEEEFSLDVSLAFYRSFRRCVVLPESRNVQVTQNDRTVTSVISEVGSYTYTFGNSSKTTVTDPTLGPLTIMVARAPQYEIPEDYAVREIEPGYHEMYDLEFTEEKTAYIIKTGLHQISSIGLPSNSMLIIERGAYLQVEDRKINNTTYNDKTAIHADGVNNVQIISRGLLDCGGLQGGENKYKHVVNTACSSNVTIEGLTIINANTWTICAYRGRDIQINRNLLLGYRTYSDGIMMSDCINSSGSYNFVRTGDDAIEFKATGWWGTSSITGKKCVYEYNDVWTDKGVGYGIIYESANNMTGMVFRNNSIGFAQSAWTERNAAIDCHLGSNAKATWSDITFENIEIYHVISPNVVGVRIVDAGGNLKNITFKNITVNSVASGVYALRVHDDAKDGSISGIRFVDYRYCGKILTNADKTDKTLFSNKAPDYFDEVTLEASAD